MEVTGKIKIIFDEQKFDSGFFKREFVVTTEEQYPQDLKFELFKEKSELIAKFKEGEKVMVRFDIRGSEWQEKYFVNLVAWRIDAADGAASSSEPGVPAPESFPTIEPVNIDEEEDDDLPF